MKGDGSFYVSPLTLVELYSVLYRNLLNGKFRLPPGVDRLPLTARVKATAHYLLRLLDAE